MIITAAEDLFSESTRFYELSPDAIDEAERKFTEMKKQGVIKEISSFSDGVWYTTDEYSNVGLYFDFNMFSYNSHYQGLLGLDFQEFVLCVKAYIMSIFGINALASIQNGLFDLRRIINTNPNAIFGTSSEIYISLPRISEDFFEQLPYTEGTRKISDAIEKYADAKYGGASQSQRTLADFESYFLFDEYLRRFWESSNISAETRMFYYPLFLWWILTAVIPLRPREFLVLERNCLSIKNGKYYLRLRRNQLKGGRQAISYKLEKDYRIDVIAVPEKVGREFETYIRLTENFPSTEINTLFRTDPHYRRWKRATPEDSRFLTYENMRTILRYFYDEVLYGMYHLMPVCLDPGRHLSHGEISRIHLGDARHIALINLMHSGGTPMLAMYLAGHTNDQMAAHYYSNISELIECQTYMFHHKLLSPEQAMQITPINYFPPAQVGHVLSDGSTCFSSKYSNHDYSDCEKSIGPNGEIGYCPACPQHRAKGIAQSEADDIFLRQLKLDCDLLKDAVQIVRSGKGDVEEIGEALLKLQNSSYSYQQYLQEKYSLENAHGAT